MAIVFAYEKFHQYVYGQPVKVVKDHDPLEASTHEDESQPDITKASEDGLRLQRYSRDITYRQGPNIPVKHALSCVNLFNDSPDEEIRYGSSVAQPCEEFASERRTQVTDANSHLRDLQLLQQLRLEKSP